MFRLFVMVDVHLTKKRSLNKLIAIMDNKFCSCSVQLSWPRGHTSQAILLH